MQPRPQSDESEHVFPQPASPHRLLPVGLIPAARGLIALIILSGLLLGISSCASTPEEIATMTALQELEAVPPLIERSFLLLSGVQEPDSRLFVLTNAARSLVIQGDPELAEQILEISLENVRIEYSESRLTEVLIQLSRAFIDTGVISRSLELLEEALQQARREQDSVEKAELIQEIIIACFTIGSDAVDLLRQAVQQIYIIENYKLRSDILLDTARRYQESGEAQRSNTLLQQAIPAAGSIQGSLERSRAFSELGLRLGNAGEQRLAEIYSLRSIEEMNLFRLEITQETADVENTDDNAPTAITAPELETRDRVVSEVLINLARSGYASETLVLNNVINNQSLRLGVLQEAARSFYEGNQFLQGDLVLERIFTILEQESPPELIVSNLLNIARIFNDQDDLGNARVYADAVDIYFADITDPVQLDSLLLETSLVQGELGEIELALEKSREITDSYFAVQALVGLSDQVNTYGDQNPELLITASGLDLSGSFLSDLAYSDIAIAFVGLGLLEEGLSEADQIIDPYTYALTLSRMQALVSLTPEIGLQIREIWDGLR